MRNVIARDETILKRAKASYKAWIYCLVSCFISFQLFAQQNTDNQYKKPLQEVLKEIEARFGVQIKYSETQVKDKWVNYANWRFRTTVDETLTNVLMPLDMKVNKEKDKVYKLKEYEYHRWEVKDGWTFLDELATKYKDQTSWEARKALLKPALYEALQLAPLPAKPLSKPIITKKRIMDGYTIENIAIEILPGLYVNGSLYKPLKFKGKIPLVLSPDGHWEKQRYRADCQIRCAMIAKMGAMAFSYDLFAWGESMLQFKYEDHRRSLSQTIQTLGGIRILDYFTSLKETDTSRIGISGGSGAGSHSILMTAIDNRIKLSAPVVAMSSYFYGGCPCESGMPIHFCEGGTNNVELAAMAAPKPMLIVSDGGDWTAETPQHDFPYLQKIYRYYGVSGNVENVHLPTEKHDFGVNKRVALYDFLAKHFKLNADVVKDKNGRYDESKCTIEPEKAMYVFGEKGEFLPKNAIMGFDQLEKFWNKQLSNPAHNKNRYKVAVIDLMILKRQKLSAFQLTKDIGADGLELDMGGLGNRETFDNQLSDPTVRAQFLGKAKELKLEICALAMTGFYAQSFAKRPTYIKMVQDCINTMQLMNVKVGFLPLGIQGDLTKYPELREPIVERLKVVGKMAEEAGVVIGIETALDAKGELQLLKEIGSKSIKSYFNFSNAIKNGRDLHKELRILGKENIVQIHATNEDGVWLQDDPKINMLKVKHTLDNMGWSGWLVIERSRDASNTKDVKRNFSANTSYLKKIFQTN